MPSVCPRLACCPPMPALQLAGWALGKVIGHMELSEVGMNNVYKECLYVVIEH